MEKINTDDLWGENGWNNFFDKKDTSWRNKDYRYIYEIFDLSLLKGSCLDAGCAMGDGLLYLKSKAPNITSFSGTDFSTKAIDRCKSNSKLSFSEFFQHDLHNPLPKCFDNIICLQTLEHLQEPLKAIENLINATKNILIISAPNENKRPDSDHVWKFSVADFQKYGTCTTDQDQKNIFLIVDKNGQQISFKEKNIGLVQGLKKRFDFLFTGQNRA